MNERQHRRALIAFREKLRRAREERLVISDLILEDEEMGEEESLDLVDIFELMEEGEL
jgi:hypothetical protein